MKNIMKSIEYEIWHNKMLIRIYIFFIFMMGLVAVLNVEEGGTGAMLAENPTITYEFSIYIIALFVGVICGEDYKDKVANYEILSGHSRISIFMARSLMSIFTAAFLATVLGFVPVIVGNVYAGFGDSLKLIDVIIRQLLFFFPYMRLAAFLVVITYLTKNQYIIMASGLVIMIGSSILADILRLKGVFISTYNLELLVDYKGWDIYNVDPVKGIVEYHSYVSTVTPNLVVGTILVSLLMTAFYIFMGYGLFRRDELN